jgi:hypothetical protein
MALNKGDIGVFLFDPLQPQTLWEYIGKTIDGFHVFKCGNTMREIKTDQLSDFWRILPAR